MDDNFQNYKSQTETISQEINFLKNQHKRKNLIVYNLKEEIQESRKELEGKTISLFSNIIKISIDLSLRNKERSTLASASYKLNTKQRN